jgi:hypothetical protein
VKAERQEESIMRAMSAGAMAAVLALTLGCTSGAGAGSGGSTYAIKGVQIEGCECDTYCPCVFQKDATGMDCRGVIGWSIQEGRYRGTDLSGLVMAGVLTKSGKNVEKSMGKWEGILYLPEKASPEQRKALEAIMKDGMGGAFAKLEVKTAPVDIKCPTDDHHEVTVGKVLALKITGLKGANGQVSVIENAPSPLVLPKLYCAKADVHTYDDGVSKWDFAGHNGYYGMFEMKSRQ